MHKKPGWLPTYRPLNWRRLNEITLFGLDEDIKLSDVFEKMKTVKAIPDSKTDGNKLRVFFREVAPDHDEEKVYASDMKKVISWFYILKDMPLFNEAEPGEAVAEEAPIAEEIPVAEVAAEPVVEKKATVSKKSAKPAEAEKPAVKMEEAETSPAKPKVKKPVAKKPDSLSFILMFGGFVNNPDACIPHPKIQAPGYNE